VATFLLQCVGENGQILEGSRVVGHLGDAEDARSEPRERQRPPWYEDVTVEVAEDVAQKGALEFPRFSFRLMGECGIFCGAPSTRLRIRPDSVDHRPPGNR